MKIEKCIIVQSVKEIKQLLTLTTLYTFQLFVTHYEMCEYLIKFYVYIARNYFP